MCRHAFGAGPQTENRPLEPIRFRSWRVAIAAALVFAALTGRVPAEDAPDDAGAAPALTAEDIVYLRTLLDRRAAAPDLPEDEARILRAARAHLDGASPVPTAQADRATMEERLKTLLRAAAVDDPDARPPRMDLAWFYLYLGEPDKAVRHLVRAGPASEDDVFWPLVTAYTYLRLGEHRHGATFLAEAQQAAQPLLPLLVRKALFCKRVRGLGQYQTRANVFRPGETAWIYVEIYGAGFRKRSDDLYALDLDLDLAIRDATQRELWKRDQYANFPFEYQHRVHDVFGGMDFALPDDLGPGEYFLILTVRDRITEKSATADIPFTIAGGAP